MAAEPAALNDANGQVDTPEPRTQLEEPEVEDIKTVTGDTMYSSASRFEDLPISEQLLQVLPCLRAFSLSLVLSVIICTLGIVLHTFAPWALYYIPSAWMTLLVDTRAGVDSHASSLQICIFHSSLCGPLKYGLRRVCIQR